MAYMYESSHFYSWYRTQSPQSMRETTWFSMYNMRLCPPAWVWNNARYNGLCVRLPCSYTEECGLNEKKHSDSG
eukprot:801597-Rhodomonas_salina.1